MTDRSPLPADKRLRLRIPAVQHTWVWMHVSAASHRLRTVAGAGTGASNTAVGAVAPGTSRRRNLGPQCESHILRCAAKSTHVLAGLLCMVGLSLLACLHGCGCAHTQEGQCGWDQPLWLPDALVHTRRKILTTSCAVAALLCSGYTRLLSAAPRACTTAGNRRSKSR